MQRKWRTLGGAATVAIAGALTLAVTPSIAAPAGSSTTQNGPMQTPSTTNNGSMGMQGSSGMNASSPYGAHASTTGQSAVEVSKPKSTLASAKVEDSSGATIGKVSKVTTSATGKAKMIDISLTSSGKKVKLDASKLRYEPTSHVLKADMTKAEIQSMSSMSTQTP